MRIGCFSSIFLLMFAVTAFGADPLPPKVENFLNNREILGVVLFDSGSAVLSPSARGEIDRLIPKLRKIDHKKQIIRIEGFSSQATTTPANATLSMMRAKAVINYLLDRHKMSSDLYLTGYDHHGGEGGIPTKEQVEFALYEDVWDFEQLSAVNSVIR